MCWLVSTTPQQTHSFLGARGIKDPLLTVTNRHLIIHSVRVRLSQVLCLRRAAVVPAQSGRFDIFNTADVHLRGGEDFPPGPLCVCQKGLKLKIFWFLQALKNLTHLFFPPRRLWNSS